MLRLVGVSLNNVISLNEFNQQLSLFDYSQQSENIITHTDQLINELNSQFDHKQFMKASSLLQEPKQIQKKYLKNNE